MTSDQGLHSDKRCIGTNASGEPCGGFHTGDSPYCFRHGPLAAEFEGRRQAALRKRANLADQLLNEYHELKTSEDYVNFIEKCMNAVLMGIIDPKKCTMLTQFMAYAGQHLKALREGDKKADLTGLRVTETKTLELTWQTESDLDRFLQAGDPRIQVKILEEMQKNKKARSIPMRPDEPIDVEASVEEPEPARHAQKHINLHAWQKKLIPQPGGFHFLENVCTKCGTVSKIASRTEECTE